MRIFRQWSRVGLAAALIAAVAGCGSGNADDASDQQKTPGLTSPQPLPNLGPITPKSVLSCKKGSHLTYENFGAGFLRNYCVTCHSAALAAAQRGGAPDSINLDSAGDAALWRAEMLADAAKMPPSQNVTTLDKSQFAEWLNCGAPTNANPSQ